MSNIVLSKNIKITKQNWETCNYITNSRNNNKHYTICDKYLKELNWAYHLIQVLFEKIGILIYAMDGWNRREQIYKIQQIVSVNASVIGRQFNFYYCWMMLHSFSKYIAHDNHRLEMLHFWVCVKNCIIRSLELQ